jgi:hypothetical protein
LTGIAIGTGKIPTPPIPGTGTGSWARTGLTECNRLLASIDLQTPVASVL